MKPDTRAFYLDAVTRVLRPLVSQLDAAPDLSALAAQAQMSPYHFHRVFRGMVGETPLELLRRLRLERAAHVLCTTEQAVTQVAFASGFETHEAFTRAFRTAFGESPSAFRQNPRARAHLTAPSGLHFDTADITAVFVPRNTGGQFMDVHLEHLPPLRLATVLHTGPFNQIGAAFERLGAIAGRAGLYAHPGAMMVATYDDDPEGKPAEELRSRAGISIPDGIPMPDGLEEQRIPGGAYACHTHMGGYETLGDVWSRFMGEALPASGHVVTEGPALEIYRTDMRSTPKAEWRTDLLVPVR